MAFFEEWARRHLAADPMEPASPPPFKVDDRVIIRHSNDTNTLFVGGMHGVVVDVDFITDAEDPYGPYATSVALDSGLRTLFSADELMREPSGYEATGPIVEDTPVYDQVQAEALAADGIAAEVEAWLKALTEGHAS